MQLYAEHAARFSGNNLSSLSWEFIYLLFLRKDIVVTWMWLYLSKNCSHMVVRHLIAVTGICCVFVCLDFLFC